MRVKRRAFPPAERGIVLNNEFRVLGEFRIRTLPGRVAACPLKTATLENIARAMADAGFLDTLLQAK